MTRDFETDNSVDFEQFKINTHLDDFGQVKIDPNCFSLTTLGKSQLFY